MCRDNNMSTNGTCAAVTIEFFINLSCFHPAETLALVVANLLFKDPQNSLNKQQQQQC
jgi:hypothetical protein